MLGLASFPALRSIFIAQQTLSKLAGLECCPLLEARLRCSAGSPPLWTARPLARAPPLTRAPPRRAQSLWVVECALESLAGLPPLAALTELQLYSNRIRTLAAAPRLPALRTLSVAGNALVALDAEALARLPALTGAPRPRRSGARAGDARALPRPPLARPHARPHAPRRRAATARAERGAQPAGLPGRVPAGGGGRGRLRRAGQPQHRRQPLRQPA
jgi:hypothetical protein